MATIYLSSVDGSDADDGLSWGNAKATMVGALAVATDASNTIYVDSAHSESFGSAANFDWDVATSGSHVAILSVDRTTGDHETGATFTGTSNGAQLRIGAASRDQRFYLENLTITMNSGTSQNGITFANATTSDIYIECVNCAFSTPSTTTSTTTAPFIFGTAISNSSVEKAQLRFTNCSFATVNNTTTPSITLRFANIVMKGCSFTHSGANKSPALFMGATTSGRNRSDLMIADCDLSGFSPTGGNYFNVTNFYSGRTVLKNSKLNSTPGLVTGTWPNNNSSIMVINTDSADTINSFEFRNRLGTLTETTSIYANDGGQFDSVGYGLEIVTSSSASEENPFITPVIMRWNASTSSIDVGVRIVHDSATDLHNRNAWIEVDYPASASLPNYTHVTNRNTEPFDGTSVDWTNDSETWTGTGGFGSANTQTIQNTFTPAEKGLIRARVYVAEASKTLYLDSALRNSSLGNNPKIYLTEEGLFLFDSGGSSGGGPIFGGMVIR